MESCSARLNDQRAREPDREPDRQLNRRAPEEQPDDLRESRAERHPHADLLHSLGDAVSGEGVEPDGGEDQRDQGASVTNHDPITRLG